MEADTVQCSSRGVRVDAVGAWCVRGHVRERVCAQPYLGGGIVITSTPGHFAYLPSTSHGSKHCNPATSLCAQSKVTEVAREMPEVGAAGRAVPKPASPPLLAQGVLERNILSRCSEVEAKWGESLRRSLGRTLTPDDVLAADTCARSEQCRGSPRRTAALDAMPDAG